MMSVTQLAQFLLTLDPQKNPARLAFYHYVKNWLPPETSLQLQQVDEFFDRCLGFDYWQSHRESLGDTVAGDLTAFYKGHTPPFDISQLALPAKRQSLYLEQTEDFQALIKSWAESKKEMGDQIRILPVGENQLMLLRLLGMGGLEVRVFTNMVRVLQGQLVPTAPVTRLSYGPQLDLLQHKRMVLAGPMMSSFVFELNESGPKGLMTRGHSFQKIESMAGQSISSYPELFYSLKRVEKFYVKPQSDPFYQELISLLEKSYQLISAGEPRAEQLAETALNKGRLALKNIFPGDKLLLLLITNIEYWLVQRKKGVRTPLPGAPTDLF
jgi:hypothetical protein